jgi:hypothetical protein
MPHRNRINIHITPGLDHLDLELIQLLEKQIDTVLFTAGYTRSMSGKCGDKVFFTYHKHEST